MCGDKIKAISKDMLSKSEHKRVSKNPKGLAAALHKATKRDRKKNK